MPRGIPKNKVPSVGLKVIDQKREALMAQLQELDNQKAAFFEKEVNRVFTALRPVIEESIKSLPDGELSTVLKVTPELVTAIRQFLTGAPVPNSQTRRT